MLTLPILQQAMRDGKRVAVPKVFGDNIRFLWLDDLSRVSAGYRGIPEPMGSGPIADDPTALVLMPGLAFTPTGSGLATAAASTTASLPQSPIRRLPFAMIFSFCPSFRPSRMTFW